MIAIKPTVAEISVSYINKQRASERPTISSSSDAHKHLLSGFNPDTISLQEQFVVLYLNRANQVLGIYKVASGGISSLIVDPRMILSVALKIAASSIICSHNHPSGNMKPSRQDEELTQKLKEGARFLDVKILDHLIVSPCGQDYYSFGDEGLL